MKKASKHSRKFLKCVHQSMGRLREVDAWYGKREKKHLAKATRKKLETELGTSSTDPCNLLSLCFGMVKELMLDEMALLSKVPGAPAKNLPYCELPLILKIIGHIEQFCRQMEKQTLRAFQSRHLRRGISGTKFL